MKSGQTLTSLALLYIIKLLQNSAAQDCQCVPLHRCMDGGIIDDKSNLNPNQIPKLKKNEVRHLSGRNNKVCRPKEICCESLEASEFGQREFEQSGQREFEQNGFKLSDFEHRCGTRNTGGPNVKTINTRMSSSEAEFGEFPWQAAVFGKVNDEYFEFKCGGTLITDNHILTVAHCVQPFLKSQQNLVVRLGEWNMDSEDESHEDYNVVEIVVHPKFVLSDLRNDLAILKLAQNVVFKPHIDTVCLPLEDDDFTGEQCIVTGWGTTSYQDETFSTTLKEAHVPILGRKQCGDMLRQTRLGKKFKLHDSFICAGGEDGLDSCKGDGGGPLVCPSIDGTYTLAGLVAWGIGCGQPGVPGVYVNVGKYVSWIARTIGRYEIW